MADIRPIGIDQTTGQQRSIMPADTVVDNIGNNIEIYVQNNGDYSGCNSQVKILFPFESPIMLSDPSSQQASANGATVSWSPNGEFLWYTHQTSPFHDVYQRNGTSINLLASPSSLPPSNAFQTSWSSCGNYFIMGGSWFSGAQKILMYQVTDGNFTLLPEPASLPPGTVGGIDFSPNGEFVVASNFSNPPFVNIYRRSGTTLTLLPEPASLPGGTAGKVKWASNGEFFAVGDQSGNSVSVYQRTGIDEFTLLLDPSTTGFDVNWSGDSRFLITSRSGGPGFNLYERNGTTFTKLADPATFESIGGQSVSISTNGKYIAVAPSTGGVNYFERNGTTLTALGDPSSIPTNVNSISWSSDQQFIAYARDDAAAPRLFIHQTSVTLPNSGVVTTFGKPNAGA